MKTVLITGANRGLGLEFTRQYAQAGWQVIACCRNPEKASALAQLASSSKLIRIVQLDVQNHPQIDSLAAELNGVAIDILIANAGVYGEHYGLGSIDYQHWHTAMEVNVFSAIKLAEVFAANLALSKQGMFIALSSLMGSMTDNTSGGSYIYRSSKAALNAAMKSLSFDFREQGTGVIIFHPGWVRTDMGGPHGLIEVDESISGMRQVIENFKMAQTGSFIKYNGMPMPW
ncbi:SDR family oxidoreductase [Methyloprofundus sp.]|uniref:SDR family oxidoreductase n=1 Tax=Methyloprofundus sp. TaxID=2020875 RepID=UPI003D0E9DF9